MPPVELAGAAGLAGHFAMNSFDCFLRQLDDSAQPHRSSTNATRRKKPTSPGQRLMDLPGAAGRCAASQHCRFDCGIPALTTGFSSVTDNQKAVATRSFRWSAMGATTRQGLCSAARRACISSARPPAPGFQAQHATYPIPVVVLGAERDL